MNKRTWTLVGAVLALAAVVVWALLPIYTFKLIIPLYSLNGWALASILNPIMYLPLLLLALMFFCAAANLTVGMLVTGIVNLIACAALVLLRHQVVMHGNLSALLLIAEPLINQAAQMIGQAVTESNINMAIEFVSEKLLHGGIGFWITLMLNIVYMITPILGESAESENIRYAARASSQPTMSSGNSMMGSGTTGGYKHRT